MYQANDDETICRDAYYSANLCVTTTTPEDRLIICGEDINFIPDIYNTNMYTSIDYKLDTPLDKVKKETEEKGFSCSVSKDTINQ